MSFLKQADYGGVKKYYRKKSEPKISLPGGVTPMEDFLRDCASSRERNPVQAQVHDAIFVQKYQYVFLRAGRKGTKTTTAIECVWEIAQLYPMCVIYFCYPTIAQGIEVVWEERRLQTYDRRDEMMFEKYVDKCDDTRHIVKFKNGSFVKLIGTWSEARGRGTQPDFLIFDEFQDCASEYIEAMDANLAAKPHSQCLIMGTPPKKRNHYEEWWDRVGSHPRGKTFHFTSYDNTSLPHLKDWLDNKRIELIKANKEDVWLREYMAELCYSSADRVLPDVTFTSEDNTWKEASLLAFADRIPVVAISIQPGYFCAILAWFTARHKIFVQDNMIIPQVWDKSFNVMWPLLADKIKVLQEFCGKKLRKLVWDESSSFPDVIKGFTKCRTDQKWQHRGLPLLRELMVGNKMVFNEKVADFGLECQNMLLDESIKDVQKNYPHACTLAMLVNEYFTLERAAPIELDIWDKYAGLREMGIPCPPKRTRDSIFTIGI